MMLFNKTFKRIAALCALFVIGSVQAQTPDEHLKRAILKGNIESIGQALENGADINRLDEIFSTPLHLTINYGPTNKIAIVTFLLKHGANPNTTNKFSSTPLHEAVRTNNPGIIALLLEYKADPNSKNIFREPPFFYFNAEKTNVEAVTLLLFYKATVNNKLVSRLIHDLHRIKHENIKPKHRLNLHILALAWAATTEQVEKLIASYPELETDLATLSEEYQSMYKNLCRHFAYEAACKGSLQMQCFEKILADPALCAKLNIDPRTFRIADLDLIIPQLIALKNRAIDASPEKLEENIAPASSLEDAQAEAPKRKRDEGDTQPAKRVHTDDEDQEQIQAPIEITTVDEVPAITMQIMGNEVADSQEEQLRTYRAKHKALHRKAH
jgi:hypothetical protein